MTFILNSYQGLSEDLSFAKTYMSSLQSFESEMQESRAILCSLEQTGNLPFDEIWHEHADFEVPERCLAKNQGPQKFKKLRVKTSSIRLSDEMRCWDHKVEWSYGDKDVETLFFRQDKKYVGAHSSRGWSVWIERRTGDFRYEFGDAASHSHVRLKGRGRLHPIKGMLEDLSSLQVVHVSEPQEGFVASTLIGSRKSGFRLLAYEGKKGQWLKVTEQCNRGEPCSGVSLPVDEKTARSFSKVASGAYRDFIRMGRPLAFASVDANELIPTVAPYR